MSGLKIVRKFSFAIVGAAVLTAVAVPASAQMMGPGYQGLALIEAVKNRDGDKAQQILGDNPPPAIVNARDADNNSALAIAIAARDPEWTGYLLNKGADPDLVGDKAGDTPLIIASRIGFEQAVQWLLGMGAKVNAANRMGETALIAAVQQRQVPIVRMLLNAGADPDKTDTAQGYSAREYAERDTRSREILQLINAKKPKPAAATAAH
jgi:ankyrin repeat protein